MDLPTKRRQRRRRGRTLPPRSAPSSLFLAFVAGGLLLALFTLSGEGSFEGRPARCTVAR
jgi:hypothetical protein